VANLSRAAQAAELDLAGYDGRVPVEMVGGSAFPPIGQLPYLLTLPPYGFYWFQLATSHQMPSWHQEPVETMPDFQTLVLKRLDTLTAANKRILETESLPAYLPKRRWFEKHGNLIQIWSSSTMTLSGQPAAESVAYMAVSDSITASPVIHILALILLRQPVAR